MGQLDRIAQRPDVMGGKACIRGMGVTVGMVVGQIGAGQSIDDILKDYPCLERADIMQALRHAAWRAEQREAFEDSYGEKLLTLAGSVPRGTFIED
jgi:uncharacterized protein (DUF433 family)